MKNFNEVAGKAKRVFTYVFLIAGALFFNAGICSDDDPLDDLDDDGGGSAAGTWTMYNTDNGYPGGRVKDIAVDTKNNVWIASENGLHKYDGTTWTTFDKTTGLPSNDISMVAADGNGNILIEIGSTTMIYDGKTWKDISLKRGNGDPIRLSSNVIRTPDGHLWTNADWYYLERGIAHWNGTSWSVTSDGAGDWSHTSFAYDASGDVWYTRGYGAYGTTGEAGGLYKIGDSGPTLARSYSLYNLSIDSKGNKWMTWGSTLIKLASDNKTLTDYSKEKVSDEFELTGIGFTLVDDKDNLWTSLNRLDPRLVKYDGKKWTFYPGPENVQGMGGIVAMDSKGVLWIAGFDYVYSFKTK
ncbi:hypothetical protein AGMMS49574_28450 [Bacteroidia bacterium]|nr:hypothetical protein AGMMS49574_28450 [Bacteroidia bacterium]